LYDSDEQPITFSTGPADEYTHWKQTVFYLKDDLTVCAGESITGNLSCKRNERNPRDLDIDVEYSFQGKYTQAARKQEYRLR